MAPKFEYIATCQNCGDLTTYSNNRAGKKILCSTCRGLKYHPPLYCKKMKAEILQEFGGKCYYCRKEAAVVDHLTPLSKGGTHERTNLVAACHACNSKKGSKTVQEFSAFLKSPLTEQ